MYIKLPCPYLVSQIATLPELLVEFNRRDWYHYQFAAGLEFDDPDCLTLRSLTYTHQVRPRTGRSVHDNSLTLEFKENPDSIRTQVQGYEGEYALDLTHLLTESSLLTRPTQEFLTDSVLTRSLRRAHRSILSGELRNTYADLELTVPRLRRAYSLFVPSLDGRNPLEIPVRLRERLGLDTYQYSVPGTKLNVQSQTWALGFKSLTEATACTKKLFGSKLRASDVTYLRVDLSSALGVFRCPWPTGKDARILPDTLIPYGQYRFDKEGFLALGRPLLFEETWVDANE